MKNSPLTPYISLYHHRHGVDAQILTHKNAEGFWRRCGFEPNREDEYVDSAPLNQPWQSAQHLLLALREIRDALLQIDDEWRNLDATFVDQQIAVSLHHAEVAIAQATGDANA